MPSVSRRPGLPTMMFLSELAGIGFHRVPPVTLSLLAIQFLIYFGLLDDFHSFSPENVCIGYDTVWRSRDFWRLFTGALVHLDEWHLYFNMASLLWKGTRLEGRRFSSVYYFCLILTFIPLCSIGTIVLDYALAELLNDRSHLRVCAAGFSGVLFALKVLASHYDDAHTVFVMGSFPISSRYACWAELIAIQMVTPNASFTGHLAGIVVGLLYIYKPLKYFIDFFYYGAVEPLSRPSLSSHRQSHQQSRTSSNGWPSVFQGQGSRVGGGGGDAGSGHYNSPSAPYTQYTAGLSEEDQMAWAMQDSIGNQTPNRRHWAGAAGDRASAPSPPLYGWNFGN